MRIVELQIGTHVDHERPLGLPPLDLAGGQRFHIDMTALQRPAVEIVVGDLAEYHRVTIASR